MNFTPRQDDFRRIDAPAINDPPRSVFRNFDDHLAITINAMNLKNQLCDVETDRRDRVLFASSKSWAHNSAHSIGAYVPVEVPSTASIGDIACLVR